MNIKLIPKNKTKHVKHISFSASYPSTVNHSLTLVYFTLLTDFTPLISDRLLNHFLAHHRERQTHTGWAKLSDTTLHCL